jgi:hypothetical protein
MSRLKSTVLQGLATMCLLLLVPSPTQAQGGYCYECVSNSPCMDCAHPVILGHISCIPYCNGTCSVGGQCTAGQVGPRLAPDGLFNASAGEYLAGTSAWEVSSRVLSTPPFEPFALVRACQGFVIQVRGPMIPTQVRTTGRTISL